MSRLASSPRLTLVLIALAVLGLAVLLRVTETNLAAAQTPILTAARVDLDPGIDPAAPVWQAAGGIDVGLTAQQITYPIGGSVPLLNARALYFNNRLYLRLAWDDDSLNDSTFAVEDFSDAVAVEFPAEAATSVPSVCMGQADAGVNIWYWRADSQTGVITNPADIYLGTSVDTYPLLGDPLDFPARAAGNPLSNVGPVQNLVAQAFGTLAPAADQSVLGSGNHDDGSWAVVISRPFSSASQHETTFGVGTMTDIAFAVWDGEQDERNGQKAISQFVRLDVSGDADVVTTPPTPDDASTPAALDEDDGGISWPAAVALAIAVPLILVIMLAMFNSYSSERRV
jgi:hypothetical protein